MGERQLITTVIDDSRSPEFSLAMELSKRTPGALVLPETTPDIFSPRRLSLMVDPANRDDAQGVWKRITDTYDFQCLQKAYDGEVDFFKSMPAPNSLIFPGNQTRFIAFYFFLRALAFDRAMEKAALQEDQARIVELKLEARKDWVPLLREDKKGLNGSYINSVMGRLYNLVTTGEEKPTTEDRVLDSRIRRYLLSKPKI